MNAAKYAKPYYMPPQIDYSWTAKTEITKPPVWCSVDLRDGNQALIEPMSLDEKLDFFKMLVKLGFKEIEVGFPAASETEYEFLRRLIEDNLIPDDVTVQVLTQARAHIIKKTFEAIKGAKHAIVHLYNSTSVAQREQVFDKNRSEILKLAVDGAKLLKELTQQAEGDIRFEYSPESFHGTEVDYAAEVCNAVLDVWQPQPDHKVVINIPSTVENAFPHVFASQVAYMDQNLNHRDSVVLSVHPHNDRGCGVATAEVSVLAGADRIEGTLFGNGERTGNADIVTIAMNMFSHGYDPGLDFSHMQEIVDLYERCTRMTVSPRQPYAGELVFTAFSGSHQDAIAKGLRHRVETGQTEWTVPYLPIDPQDVGRTYDSDVIRINSQSGKGGVSYVLNRHYGLTLPKGMQEDAGYAVKDVSDHAHSELSPERIYEIFTDRYVNRKDVFNLTECHFKQGEDITADITVSALGAEAQYTASGNGRLDAVSNAIKMAFPVDYELTVYEEHALTSGSTSKACAYIGLKTADGMIWGCGIDPDIIRASVKALISAVNNILAERSVPESTGRMAELLQYIRAHSDTVTLDELSSQFHLTVPYLSKYIKEHSGQTFMQIITDIRMQRACALLRSSKLSVQKIAGEVGYPSVEHFNRQFKKRYAQTPGEYRSAEA